ncbi:MAG: hypothetical protein JWO22_1708 [Frankiales bacterium]|nr:hypothetical protein [Frankiales bacterium]
MGLKSGVSTVLFAAVLAGCSGGSGRPGGVLSEHDFWSLVQRSGTGAVEDRAAVMTNLLSQAPATRLESWRQQLVARDADLNRTALSEAMTVVCGPTDPEGFAADRSWLVAHGERVFTTARDHPDDLAALPDLEQACAGSGAAFADAATPRYSDLGFEPGGDAFPDVDPSDPTGPSGGRFPLLHKRFG